MKRLSYFAGALVLLTVALRLFTFEYFLKDDPSTGLAWRATPSLDNRLMLDHSPARQAILIEDEDSVRGVGLYRAMTGWGVWVVCLFWLASVALAKKFSGTPQAGRD